MTTQEWARAYAALGWRVLPIVRGSKRPLYAGWQRDATIDPDLIARYWRSEPGPNIGIITGESFVAYDVEAAHLPTLRAWMRDASHQLPETPIARTGRGGIHILARVRANPSGHLLRLNGVHIGELKAVGGFVVASPSQTSGVYGWRRSPLEVQVARAPDWLCGLTVSRRPATATSPGAPIGVREGERHLAALARVVADATEGRRNNLLYWALRRAIEEGVPASVAGSVLGRLALASGLGVNEVEATVASAIGAVPA